MVATLMSDLQIFSYLFSCMKVLLIPTHVGKCIILNGFSFNKDCSSFGY